MRSLSQHEAKRKRLRSGDGEEEFDYELANPQRLKLTASEELQRNLRLLSELKTDPGDNNGEAVDFNCDDQQSMEVEQGVDNASAAAAPAVPTAPKQTKKVKSKSKQSTSKSIEEEAVKEESSKKLDINRPGAAGSANFAFGFSFNEEDFSFDSDIVESADVVLGPSAEAPVSNGHYPHDDNWQQQQHQQPRLQDRQQQQQQQQRQWTHLFDTSVQPGIEFFNAKPQSDSEQFLAEWREARDFVKADVHRTCKRAAAAKKGNSHVRREARS